MSARDVLARRRFHYSGGPNPINSCCNTSPTRCQEEAENDLFALHAAGYVVVPGEPLMRVVSGDQIPGGGRLVLEADLMALEKAVTSAQESPDEG